MKLVAVIVVCICVCRSAAFFWGNPDQELALQKYGEDFIHGSAKWEFEKTYGQVKITDPNTVREYSLGLIKKYTSVSVGYTLGYSVDVSFHLYIGIGWDVQTENGRFGISNKGDVVWGNSSSANLGRDITFYAGAKLSLIFKIGLGFGCYVTFNLYVRNFYSVYIFILFLFLF
eukprot:Phypoly_transcript_14595.p1 GENE.Phypoly_transcript_14595~~Phypoly_transcript_14595.p1  ORF type:complete len:173 (+),score=7.19 Phypoly_transcript_14595:94-612(+)